MPPVPLSIKTKSVISVTKEGIKCIAGSSSLVPTLSTLGSLCTLGSLSLSKGHPKIITKITSFLIGYHICRAFAAVVVGAAFVKVAGPAYMQICMTKRAFVSPYRFFNRNFFFTFPANHS